MSRLTVLAELGMCLFLSLQVTTLGQVPRQIDLAEHDPGSAPGFMRIAGSLGSGVSGVPVAGPGDLDGDGYADFAFSAMRATHSGGTQAGQVYLIFGNGNIMGLLDTAQTQARILKILGAGNSENAGSEIWMDDVTGDGLIDLLVSRQNYTPSQDKLGAGALTILPGGPALRVLALSKRSLSLAQPAPEVKVFTIVGRSALDRFGMWVRAGDVDGDGIADIVVSADQEDLDGGDNNGAVYVIRGGAHLDRTATISLADIQASTLRNQVVRLEAPPNSNKFHLGATCQIVDLDGNGRGEVLAAAALTRAGGVLRAPGAPFGSAEGVGGSADGTVFIAWDDNFGPAVWQGGESLRFTQLPGGETVLDGGSLNRIFGEEIVGGGDVDGDAMVELFIGDFLADGTPSGTRSQSGIGYLFYRAARLKNRVIDMDRVPADITFTRILGPVAGAIGADTAGFGDFNGDGLDDLFMGSPHDNPLSRASAGSIAVIYGSLGGWPALVDAQGIGTNLASGVRATEILGARGDSGFDGGDTLCYSGTVGDVNGDGIDDLLSNEMKGAGIAPGSRDAGNLILLDGSLLSESSVLYFAHFGGGGGFGSDLVLTNPSGSLLTRGVVQLSAGGGSIAALTENSASVLQIGQGRLEFEIPPHGAVTLSSSEEGELEVGGAQVSSTGDLGGVVRFRLPGVGSSGVSPGPPLDGFIVPIRTDEDVDVGVAVFNPGADTVSVEFTLNGDDGVPVLTVADALDLEPGGHVARFVTELFGDLGLFSGTLVVRVSGGKVAAVAVELGTKTGDFTTLSVTPLKQ